MFNTDQLTNTTRIAAARAAMQVIDGLQHHAAGAQLAGLAAAFILACESRGVHPGSTLDVAGRVMRDAEGRRPEFRAVAAYIEGEL